MTKMFKVNKDLSHPQTYEVLIQENIILTIKALIAYFSWPLLRFVYYGTETAQKMKFSIKDFCSKCEQIRSFLCIWSHLLKKSLMENLKATTE